MPVIKSAKKRVKQSERNREQNYARKHAVKTAIKKVLAALDQKNINEAKELLKEVQAKLARAKSKGVIHKNAAARKLSRLAQKVQKAHQV